MYLLAMKIELVWEDLQERSLKVLDLFLKMLVGV